MPDTGEYRAHAAECVRLAQQTADPQSKGSLFDIGPRVARPDYPKREKQRGRYAGLRDTRAVPAGRSTAAATTAEAEIGAPYMSFYIDTDRAVLQY
jgi:hypothetical protein